MQVFPKNIISAAQLAAKAYHVFASVALAQWALESDFGAHMPAGSNNPFGIKAHVGEPHVSAMTTEYIHGRFVRLPQNFVKFVSIDEAFAAHARLLATKTVYHRAMLAKTPVSMADALTGIYATDPHYGEKLIAIINKYGLTQYDI